jgi:glycosyltransferase involved in cell wall biosynthesis
MRKKRILFCSEATFLSTGYATYTREILNYLYSTGKYEIAELAAYGTENDPRFNSPWKFFGVQPPENNQRLVEAYKRDMKGQFGGFAFEKACLEFLPDFVCDIRDFWMMDFAYNSPYRKFFNWVIMPTVDAYPQAVEWIDMYSDAEACLSYSSWSGDVLEKQSGGKIKYKGTSSPSAQGAYQPVENKESLKEILGIDPNTKIIGTVMRNQRRKLYPDLFKAFRMFLDSVDNPREYKLYCHTSYPDAGWNIPELLSEHGLHSHVLFTYICPETERFFASVFNGAMCQSPFTGKFSAKLSNVKAGLSYEGLSKVINCFDLYVQYANCEGFGLPQVEAAACGVPVMSIDYSAMSSVVRQLGGTPIPYKALYKEMETGCERAVPDNEAAAKLFKDFFEKPEAIRKTAGFESRKKFLKEFNWQKSGEAWEKCFDSIDIIPIEKSWKSPLDIKEPLGVPKDIDSATYEMIISWMYDNVLQDPSKKYSYEYYQMINSLIYGFRTNQIIGSFLNEDDSAVSLSKKIEREPFTIDTAYQTLKSQRDKKNFWEQRRAEAFNL